MSTAGRLHTSAAATQKPRSSCRSSPSEPAARATTCLYYDFIVAGDGALLHAVVLRQHVTPCCRRASCALLSHGAPDALLRTEAALLRSLARDLESSRPVTPGSLTRRTRPLRGERSSVRTGCVPKAAGATHAPLLRGALLGKLAPSGARGRLCARAASRRRQPPYMATRGCAIERAPGPAPIRPTLNGGADESVLTRTRAYSHECLLARVLTRTTHPSHPVGICPFSGTSCAADRTSQQVRNLRLRNLPGLACLRRALWDFVQENVHPNINHLSTGGSSKARLTPRAQLSGCV